MSKVVITFEVPDCLSTGELSNERYDKEKKFMCSILDQIKTKIHIPSLIMQGENGIRIGYNNEVLGKIVLE